MEQDEAAQKYTARRYRNATLFELLLTIVFASLFVSTEFRALLYEEKVFSLSVISGLLRDPVPLLVIFAQYFYMVLTGNTFIVDFYRKTRGDTVTFSDADAPLLPAAGDVIEKEFTTAIRRSQETFKSAQRRPNALLLVGTAVAIGGLSFFIATIPGLFAGDSQNINALSLVDLYKRLLDLVPRLLMLLFIQVLAGFFLRQYRSSMEELRYFEAILRSRESQLIAYHVATQHHSEKIPDVFKSLLEPQDRDYLRLQQGETTITLEAQKLEANEFKGIYDKLFDLVGNALSKKTDAGPQAPAG